MKKIIITILLAFFAIVGQAQNKTSALVRGSILNMPKQAEDQLCISMRCSSFSAASST